MSNLDRDIKEAERLGYGVHYGQYKADHPGELPKAEEELPEETTKCAECGELFVPRKENQLYCCIRCKERNRNRAAYLRRHGIAESEEVAG